MDKVLLTLAFGTGTDCLVLGFKESTFVVDKRVVVWTQPRNDLDFLASWARPGYAKHDRLSISVLGVVN